MFNSVARLQVGGKWNQLLGRVEKPFLGVLAGLVLCCTVVLAGLVLCCTVLLRHEVHIHNRPAVILDL